MAPLSQHPPLDTPVWGDTCNRAHILVPFSFTAGWSHNKY
jgi:hypothetical protein